MIPNFIRLYISLKSPDLSMVSRLCTFRASPLLYHFFAILPLTYVQLHCSQSKTQTMRLPSCQQRKAFFVRLSTLSSLPCQQIVLSITHPFSGKFLCHILCLSSSFPCFGSFLAKKESALLHHEYSRYRPLSQALFCRSF